MSHAYVSKFVILGMEGWWTLPLFNVYRFSLPTNIDFWSVAKKTIINQSIIHV
jgi:hypothetical protein